MKKSLLLSMFCVKILLGNEILEDFNKNLVIYNQNLGFVSEIKKVNINKGESDFIYENVSPNIITDSVSVVFPNNVILKEQNYKYDIVNFNNILKYYVNKEIEYKHYFNEKEYNIETAILLSYFPSITIQDKTTNKIFNINQNDIIISKLPENMSVKPSLIWKINSKEDFKNKDLKLSYLTNNISWNTTYIATIENRNLNLNSWITIRNDSDINYNNYNLSVLAGQINKNNNYNNPKLMRTMQKSIENDSFSPEISEESLSGYHIYKIPDKINISSLSMKQINLFNNNIKNYKKINKLNLYSISNNKEKYQFEQYIEFKNTKQNGIGIPLPEGNIRFYERDKENNYFIGENTINNSPENEEISLKIGKNFDSKLEFTPKETSYQKNNEYFLYELEISNNGENEEYYNLIQQNPLSHLKSNQIEITNISDKNFEFMQRSVNEFEYKFKLKAKENIKILISIKRKF